MENNRIYIGSIGVAIILGTVGMFGGVEAQVAGIGDAPALTLQADDSLSGPQQINWIQQMAVRGKKIKHAITLQLENAKNKNEPLKIVCLQDKLAQTDANLTGIEERTKALKGAHSAGDTRTANQNFSILKIYVSKIMGLSAEAENCLGESDVVFGKTSTDMSIDGFLPAEDPSKDLAFDPVTPTDVETDPPEHTSGYF